MLGMSILFLMLFHMFLEVALLCKFRISELTGERLLPKMHPCVIKEVPSLDEVLGSPRISTMDDSLPPPWALTGDIADLVLISFKDRDGFISQKFLLGIILIIWGDITD